MAKCRLLCRNSMKPLNHAIALRDYHSLLTSKKSLSSDWNMKIARKNIVIYKTMSFTCPLSSFAIYCDYLVSAVVHLFCYANVSRCSFDKMWRHRTTEALVSLSSTAQNYWSTLSLSSTTTSQHTLHFWASVLTEPCVVNCAAEEWGYKTKSWPINSAIAKLTDFGYIFP